MTTEAIDETGLTVIEQAPEYLARSVSPEGTIELASRMATALADIVEKQKLFTIIQGKKFPNVEAWMTIGRMDNVVCREREDQPVIRHDDGSYEAFVELVRLSDGMVTGRGSALCGSPKDNPWTTRADNQKRSMAVTRATSRAFRQQYSWIMALAGYEPTPADEMPVPDVSPRREDAPRRDETEDHTQHGDQGLIGSVEKGKPPVDMETRQTPEGPAWGFKLAQGRKGFQAIATGSLAEVLAVSGLEEGTRVTVWGRVEEVDWWKKQPNGPDKKMPPYLRVHIERVQTPEWTLPAETIEVRARPDLTPGSDPEHDFDGPDPFEAPTLPLPMEPLTDDEKAAIAGSLPGA